MKLRRWFLLVVISAIITHAATFSFAPYAMMKGAVLSAKYQDKIGELNIFSERVVAGKDIVVRMSPDLLYSSCAFIMDEGPYRINVPPIDSYMSVSLFAHNTDNIFSVNDLESPDGIDIVLAKKGASLTLPKGARLLETDTPYGMLLLRYYIGDREVESFHDLMHQARCEKFVES